jgi:hypothetical protein
MKLPPHIDFPEGGTPTERLDLAFRRILTVSKEALLKEEAQKTHKNRHREKKKKR